MENNSPANEVDGRWVLGPKLARGGYGYVYEATDRLNIYNVVVKKSRDRRKNWQMEGEAAVYRALEEVGGEGFPKLVSMSILDGHCVLILERLGKRVGYDFTKRRSGYSMEMLVKIGTSLIKRLKHLHKAGYVHRDIRPHNVLFGAQPGLSESQQEIYLIDFGISQRFLKSDGRHIEKRKDRRLAGNKVFASSSYHKNTLHSRRDDLESFLYLIAFLLKGYLPWDIFDDNTTIKQRKEDFSSSLFFQEMPKAYAEMWRYLKKLDFKEEPDYAWVNCKTLSLRDRKMLREK